MKRNTQKINRYAIFAIGLILTLGFVFPVLASEINAENVIRYVNEAREKEGLQKLTVSEKLNEVAMAKVNDMVANKYFAHTSPKGFNPWHWFELVGYDYKYAGENLAINFVTAEAQQLAWMNSPTHRKNILNVNYKEIGVAVAAGEVDNTMGIIAVQEFGTLAYPGKAENDNNDFAPANDNVLPDTTRFVPAVLSVGDNKADDKELKDFIEEGGGQKSNFFWLVLFGLMVLPILIVQVVFVGKFMGISWLEAVIQKSYKTAREKNSQKYFRKLKVRDYGEYSLIKVKTIRA
jgi:hypothetical protein